MILYSDTSALIKKYIKELGSDQVFSYFDQYPYIGTSALTQVEVAGAISKAIRQGWVSAPDATVAWQDFLSHWPAYTRIPVSSGIIDRATDLAWHYVLRAYDSLHLSSALTWQDVSGSDVVLACYDKQLRLAAKLEGLNIWPENVI